MNDTCVQEGEGQPLATARRVDQVCKSFETAWRASPGDPRIEDFLGPVPQPERSSVLRELVPLELELRQAQGETPLENEYKERFPDHGELIHVLFSEPGPDRTAFALDGPGSTVSGPDAEARVSSGVLGSPERPRRFADYELLEEIDRGGMGVIFKARQVGLNRLVAVKMIRAGILASEAEVGRFLAEAETIARLDHPHIVPIYEVGDCQGQPFFSMKLVRGGDLNKHRSCLAKSPRAIALLLAAIARAVHHAHQQGVLHRDLKPANILLDDDGRPYVTDFGLAKWLGVERSFSQSSIVGTPAYMAPEQALGHRDDVGAASDVYSLGAILYQLLTGRPPFQADSVMDALLMVLEQDPIRPRSIDPQVDPALERICLKCLEKQPTRRYASAQSLAEDLERYLENGELVANREGIAWRLRRWARREPALVCHLSALSAYGLLQALAYTLRSEIGSIQAPVEIAILSVWALASIAFQSISRSGWGANLARIAWASTDLVALTAVLWTEQAWPASQVACYLLLVAGSGLWFREFLVWLLTALSVTAYLGLVLAERALSLPWANQQRPDVVVTALVVAGLIVGYQVKRVRALSHSLDVVRSDS
jgi:serine/threonine-protein kinase